MAYRTSEDTPSQPPYTAQQDFSATISNPLPFNEGDVSADPSHCLGQRVEKVSSSYLTSGSMNLLRARFPEHC
jgi:hypothetical protein